MERFCPQCGNLVSGDGKFCPQCGAAMASAVDLSKPASDSYSSGGGQGYTTTYAQPTQQTVSSNYAVMPNYPQNANVTEQTQHMSVGQWVGTIILTSCLGLISIVLLFVWGFGDTPQPKKNYCRAMLIMQAIAVVLVILYIILIVCIFGGLSGLFEDMSHNPYYYY